MMSIWQDIFNHLQAEGFSVYSPATKNGEAIDKYLVLKNDGSSKFGDYSTDVSYYSVMCYVPAQQYSELETYVVSAKNSMKKMFPKVKPTGNETPSFYDAAVKAHMVSLQYSNYKKL